MCTFIIVSPLNTTQPFVWSNIQSPWSTGTNPWLSTSITISVPCFTISLSSVYHDPNAWKIKLLKQVLLYQNSVFSISSILIKYFCYIVINVYGTLNLKSKLNVNLTNHVCINVYQTAKSMKIQFVVIPTKKPIGQNCAILLKEHDTIYQVLVDTL